MQPFFTKGRGLARSQALQLLFQAEALDKTVDEVLADGALLSTSDPLDPYARELAEGTYQNIAALDQRINLASRNWEVDRMPATDRNLLRMALYELSLTDENTMSVATVINDAVLLAKAYGTDDSYRFVNGVLGFVVRELGVDLPSFEDLLEELRSEEVDEEVVIDTTDEVVEGDAE